MKHQFRRVDYECPICGISGKADATRKPDTDGAYRWFVGCFACDSRISRKEYLELLADAVGASSIEELMEDPERFLVPFSIRIRPKFGYRAPAALPSLQQIAEWQEALYSSRGREALDWLKDVRGIKESVLRRFAVGWDGEAITFPLHRGKRVVNLKRRVPGPGFNMRSLPGHTAARGAFPLYGAVGNRDWVLLVEGELDCLRARSAGLPAVGVTLGAGVFRAEWAEGFASTFCAVCFDLDAQAQALRAVESINNHRSGCGAVRLDLATLGLDGEKSDLSDFFTHGGTPRDIRRAVRKLRLNTEGAAE